MTPERLLHEADRLLTSPVQGTLGCWPRACAWLIRLALEHLLDEHWGRVLPEAAASSMRTQLLLLPRYGGDPAAQLARDAWMGLARATHHHAYELAPTAAELRGWHTQVTRLGDRLGTGN
jgi:hypothetical protein